MLLELNSMNYVVRSYNSVQASNSKRWISRNESKTVPSAEQ